MMRVTHLEISSDDNSLVVMEGHRVERQCTASDRASGAIDHGWISDLFGSAVMIGAIGVEAFFRFVIRLLCLIVGGLVLPTMAELGCVTGAAVLCSVGAIGRRLSAAAEGAGQDLYHRSLLLAIATRVLDRRAQFLSANNAERQLPPTAIARRR